MAEYGDPPRCQHCGAPAWAQHPDPLAEHYGRVYVDGRWFPGTADFTITSNPVMPEYSDLIGPPDLIPGGVMAHVDLGLKFEDYEWRRASGRMRRTRRVYSDMNVVVNGIVS